MGAAEHADSPPGSCKEDPDGLVLRGRPRPAIRFRRGFIIALAAAAGTALIALAWVALQPASFVTARDRAIRPLARPSPEGLAGAPASYADVPQLGPPLPGDLGRAIVGRDRASGGENFLQPPDLGSAAGSRHNLAAERQAARESPVLVRLSNPTAPVSSESRLPPVRSEALKATSPEDGSANRLGQESTGKGGAGTMIPSPPGSPWTLSAGSVIPASLLTGLNSDLPGLVVAQVTQNVRDSATGRIVLIPQGARLIGDYDSNVAFGQKRAFLTWKRLVLPDGSSVDLGDMPATDAAGYSGLEDKVDFHEWRLLKGVLLSSLLGVGSEVGYGGDDRDLVRALRESAQSNGTRSGDAIVSRNLGVQPTLTVRPGWPVRALLHRDLVLKPWKGR